LWISAVNAFLLFVLLILTVSFYYIVWDTARKRFLKAARGLVKLAAFNRELHQKYITMLNSKDDIARASVLREINLITAEYDTELAELKRTSKDM
jgi:hypothetical protein